MVTQQLVHEVHITVYLTHIHGNKEGITDERIHTM